MVNLFLLFTLFLSARTLLIRENVIFRKINEISPTRSTWAIAVVTVFDTYDDLIKTMNDRINASQAVIKALSKHYEFESPNHRFYNLFESLKIEAENIFLIQKHIHEKLQGYKSVATKVKRSLLPFVGSALSFLFGTVSEGDITQIRTHLRMITYNQQKLTHVVKKSLTIIKQDHQLISQNRQTINHILVQLRDFVKKVDNISEALEYMIEQTNHFVYVYGQVSLAVDDIKLLLGEVKDGLNSLLSRLNFLSLGKLTPSVMSPPELREVLNQIKGKLPSTVVLPSDPDTELWSYYKSLSCATVMEGRHLVTYIKLPLLDGHSKFEVYQTFNLPVPLTKQDPNSNKIQEKPNDSSALVAKYRLENEMLAVNTDRTKYVLLSANELQKCTDPVRAFCEIKSPIYTMHHSKNCLVALFMQNARDVSRYCTIETQANNLPLARYVSDGQWAISTDVTLKFSQVCLDDKGSVTTTRIVKPPVTVFRLPMACKALNGQLTLSPYYKQESHFNSSDKPLNLSHTLDITSLKIWDNFHRTLPNLTSVGLPEKLKPINKLPMDKLISDLKRIYFPKLKEPFHFPNWGYAVVALGACLAMGIVIFVMCRARISRRFNSLWFSKSNEQEYEMASVPSSLPSYGRATMPPEPQTNKDGTEPSAPLLRESDEGTGASALVNIASVETRNLYPKFELPEVRTRSNL